MVLRIGSDVSEPFSQPSPHKSSVTHADDLPTDPSELQIEWRRRGFSFRAIVRRRTGAN